MFFRSSLIAPRARAHALACIIAALSWATVAWPAPAKPQATVWFVQVYDVKEGQLDPMRKWLAEEGGKRFLAFPGAVSFETWVDLIHPGPTLITVLGFVDYAAIDRFYADKTMSEWGERLDSFIGPHKHYIFRQYPLYRSKSLTFPPPTP